MIIRLDTDISSGIKTTITTILMIMQYGKITKKMLNLG
jgi:hypothetical protein